MENIHVIRWDSIHVFTIIITATIYVKAVIPAKAGIQNWPGCRIKSGMTVEMCNCQINNYDTNGIDKKNQ